MGATFKSKRVNAMKIPSLLLTLILLLALPVAHLAAQSLDEQKAKAEEIALSTDSVTQAEEARSIAESLGDAFGQEEDVDALLERVRTLSTANPDKADAIAAAATAFVPTPEFAARAAAAAARAVPAMAPQIAQAVARAVPSAASAIAAAVKAAAPNADPAAIDKAAEQGAAQGQGGGVGGPGIGGGGQGGVNLPGGSSGGGGGGGGGGIYR